MLFKATFTLEGILIFSTEVRPMISAGQAMGSYISPSPYIHNYPIIYGILGKSAEAYFVIPSLHYNYYEDKKTRGGITLNYTSVNQVIQDAKAGKGFYVFPLIPQKIITESFLLSSESWTYYLPTRAPTKNVFPRVTSYTAFMPGTEFYTYIVTDGKFEIPQWIRIGKKRWGIMKIKPNEVKVDKVTEAKNCTTSIPINIKDAEIFGYKIVSYSKLYETPNVEEGLIGWATLESCYEIKSRSAKITLPIPSPFINQLGM
ncbi:type I-D CRISPR-associated protein Csc1 [Sulfurisphaera ohwakuensis]|uniref:type I-D CRISPR-associated protein Csc1 n=1 Tax=Sulfurisphaera ohwakuensis TaxID=69656 RepID=UPI0036F312FE